MTADNYNKIVFYDGSCGFCNKTVQFVFKFDKKEECYFAALQSPFAQAYFKKRGITPDLSTFYYAKNGHLYSKSTGFIELCEELKLPWRLFLIVQIIPRKIRDFCYDFIAKRRIKIAGEYCFLPNVIEQKRFITDV